MSKNFAYYNEWDRGAAAWLRELIKRGLIADGIVDERSITEVSPDDIRGFNQCHWFAGVGGWSYSLRIAGIPDEYPVWTASLPCQPFSAAGKQLGKADERHLLPHYLELVRQCKPNLQLGEQVEGAIRHGWLDDLQTTMEAEGYAVGHCILGAHSVSAPHIRQRLYWVADSKRERQQKQRILREKPMYNQESGFREADRLVDAVQRKALPFMCSWHDGIPERVGRVAIKGFGNAIVPQVAAEFIRAFMEIA